MTCDAGLRELQEGGLFLTEETTAPELDAFGLAALEVWAVVAGQLQTVEEVQKQPDGKTGRLVSVHMRAEAVAAAVQLRSPLHPWELFRDVLKLHTAVRTGDMKLPERPQSLQELLAEDPDWILHEMNRLGALPLV